MRSRAARLARYCRERGDIFAVALRPHNRWGGFKALRERWLVPKLCMSALIFTKSMAAPMTSMPAMVCSNANWGIQGDKPASKACPKRPIRASSS